MIAFGTGRKIHGFSSRFHFRGRLPRRGGGPCEQMWTTRKEQDVQMDTISVHIDSFLSGSFVFFFFDPPFSPFFLCTLSTLCSLSFFFFFSSFVDSFFFLKRHKRRRVFALEPHRIAGDPQPKQRGSRITDPSPSGNQSNCVACKKRNAKRLQKKTKREQGDILPPCSAFRSLFFFLFFFALYVGAIDFDAAATSHALYHVLDTRQIPFLAKIATIGIA